MTADDYGKLAARTSGAMKMADKDLELVLCGSSHSGSGTPHANPSASLSDGLLSIELPPVSWTAIALG